MRPPLSSARCKPLPFPFGLRCSLDRNSRKFFHRWRVCHTPRRCRDILEYARWHIFVKVSNAGRSCRQPCSWLTFAKRLLSVFRCCKELLNRNQSRRGANLPDSRLQVISAIRRRHNYSGRHTPYQHQCREPQSPFSEVPCSRKAAFHACCKRA